VGLVGLELGLGYGFLVVEMFNSIVSRVLALHIYTANL